MHDELRQLAAKLTIGEEPYTLRRSSVNRRSRVPPGSAARAEKNISFPAGESGEAAIIAIGASVGGPSAVAKVLSQIPADFPLSILLVIHSVVFGIPRGAIALDAAQVISPLADLAGTPCPMARRHHGDGT